MKLLRVLIVASVFSSLAGAGEPTTAELQSRAREFEKYKGEATERDAAARQEHAQRIEEYNRQLEAIRQQAEEARQKQERKEPLTADETAALEREKLLNDLAAQEAFVVLDLNFQDVRSQSGPSSEQLAQAQAARDDAAQALQSRNAGSGYTKTINDAAQALEQQRVAAPTIPVGTTTISEAQKTMAPIEKAVVDAQTVIDTLKNNPKNVTPVEMQKATTGAVDAAAKAGNTAVAVATSAEQSLASLATQKDAAQTKSAVQVLKEYANKAGTYVVDAWNAAADGLASTQERLDKFVAEIKTANDKAAYLKSNINSLYYAKRAIGEESAYINQVQKSLSEFDKVLEANQKLVEFSAGLHQGKDNYWTQTVKVQDLFDRVTSSLTSAQASLGKMEKVELDLSTARADNQAKRDRLDALNQRYFDATDPKNKQYKTLQDKLQADYSALLDKGRDKLLYQDLFTPTVIATLEQKDISSEQRITSSDSVAQLQQKITDNPILLDRLQEAWEKQKNIDTDLVLQKIKVLRDVTARYTYDRYLAGTVNDLAFDNTSGATMIDPKYGTWPKTYQAWKDQFNLYDAQLDISQNIFDSYQEQYKKIRQQLRQEISYLESLIKDPSLLRYSPPVDDVLVDQIKNFTGYPDKLVTNPADTSAQRQQKLQAALDWQQVKSYGYKKESDALRDLNSAFGTRTLTTAEQALVAARNQRREYLAQAKAQSDFLIADLTWQMKKEFGPAAEVAGAEVTRLQAAEALQEKGLGSAYTKSIVDKIPLPTQHPITAAALAAVTQPVEAQKNALSSVVTQAAENNPEKNTIKPLQQEAKDIAAKLDALQLALKKQREELQAAEAPEKEAEDAVEQQNEIGQSLMKFLIILLLELLKQLTDDKDHIFYMGQRFFAGVSNEDEESGDFATSLQDKLSEHYKTIFGHEEDADQKIYELLFDKVIIPLIDQNKLDQADRINPNDSRAEIQRKLQKHPELAQAARQAWQNKLLKEEGSDDAANKKAQALGIEQAAQILGNDTARYTYDSYLAGNADKLAFDNNNKEMVVDKQTWQDQYSSISETLDQLNNKASILLEEVTSQLERMKNLVPNKQPS